MRFCIDTNVFFSYQKGIDIGSSLEEVVSQLIVATEKNDIELFMPPRIVEELQALVEAERLSTVQKLLVSTTVQSPTLQTHTIGAQTLYDFVREYRDRTQQGLHVAIELIHETTKIPIFGDNLSKKETQKSLQPIIEKLRSRYRNATRTGFVDSLADLDLIFLSKEIGAYLISADEGVVSWGRKIGVREMDLVSFGKVLKGTNS
ncbi:MAG TPA: RNA ligase partner protein [Candidatus Woesebacteria bacterium]|nr:RNA ligase partner protein [Candidatus Woesebacteria bacterium]HNS94737.1 RNA ligase partner protein [Candidatus Woesebacteria bacterium]